EIVNAPVDDWTLAIDLGTSNTVVVVKDSHGSHAVEFELGKPFFPSVVFAERDGNLRSGVAAYNNRLIEPRRYFGEVKQAITNRDGVVTIADRGDWLTAEVVAAVLKEAKRAAIQSRPDNQRPPARTALTHPVAWEDDQVDILRRAAELAGL